MTLAVANYYKKTPKSWKRLGDTALFGIPLISTAIIASPLSENVKLWTLFICNITLALVKIVTKFVGEEEIVNEPQS
jgi:hypothetical protein